MTPQRLSGETDFYVGHAQSLLQLLRKNASRRNVCTTNLATSPVCIAPSTSESAHSEPSTPHRTVQRQFCPALPLPAHVGHHPHKWIRRFSVSKFSRKDSFRWILLNQPGVHGFIKSYLMILIFLHFKLDPPLAGGKQL